MSKLNVTVPSSATTFSKVNLNSIPKDSSSYFEIISALKSMYLSKIKICQAKVVV